MSSFTLDKNIFNPTLYKNIHNVWFEGYDPKASEVNFDLLTRWFLGSPEQRRVFDGVCRDNFAHALDSIGPETFLDATAEPFIQEIRNLAQRSPENGEAEAANAALSLLLLLDQMTRNIFRTNEGLAKVYGHYDKIAQSLATTLLSSPSSPVARPDLHTQWRNDVIYRQWFYMPLMHSEDLQVHNLLDDIVGTFMKEVESTQGSSVNKGLLTQVINFEKEHREILEKFGRYPHRNSALGRESTDEEKAFLAGGGATFGVSQEE
ncbi:DUF924-domain-containing protein [Corynespora cassiicola Philippines]|uniref:DUF924-domain-containing protein n=1 Tax=Corynespora cassiicola Philippines TaxID=1448308 RepID=A0A2T2N5S3_CORCC|nr:DUF924-domain-containing protein [Corynespora cassiicola Philippines]